MTIPCEQIEEIRIINKRLVDGEVRFMAIEMGQNKLLDISTEVKNLTDNIDKRLFRDNGTTSIQTKLDRHEVVIKNMLKLVWITATALVGILVIGFVRLLTHAHWMLI